MMTFNIRTWYGPYDMAHMIWSIWYGPYDMAHMVKICLKWDFCTFVILDISKMFLLRGNCYIRRTKKEKNTKNWIRHRIKDFYKFRLVFKISNFWAKTMFWSISHLVVRILGHSRICNHHRNWHIALWSCTNQHHQSRIHFHRYNCVHRALENFMINFLSTHFW